MQIGKTKHELELSEVIERLNIEGWRVVDLKAKSPDAVACKDGKLIAIEVLGIVRTKGKQYRKSWSYTAKKKLYERLGFDELKIFTFEKER